MRDCIVQAIRAQLQQAVTAGDATFVPAYGHAGEEASQDAERSIFDGGAVNALYRYVPLL